MTRTVKPPLTLSDLAHDGPPVRLRDLIAVTGLSKQTILTDIEKRELVAVKRARGLRSIYLVQRAEARRYCLALGFSFRASA
jgi:hypothetical protein